MPVVHIRGLTPDDGASMDGALISVALTVAEAVPCEVGAVWCTFTPVARQSIGTDVVERDGRIVYVDLLMRARDNDPDAVGRSLAAACTASAEAFGVPVVDVWGRAELVEPERFFAGGGPV